MRQRAIIIGAGLGGLSCAVTLAVRGWEVIVLERQPTIGGKLQRIQEGGYTFDRGPSTITMPQIFRDVFQQAGAAMEDYVELYELEPRTRNVFADGTVVNLSKNPDKMVDQIAVYSPDDARSYVSFLQESAVLARHANEQFLNRLMLTNKDKLALPLIRSFLRIRPQVKLHSLLRRYFKHPNTLAMMGRYATYVGASPYQAPSIFAMLPSVEAEGGVYGVRGGTYKLAEAIAKLAVELGVVIHTEQEVTRILVKNKRVSGVETANEQLEAAVVIANGDMLSINRMLLDETARRHMSNQKIAGYEPSLSGFVTLAGVPRTYPILHHHTVFYPSHYAEEFVNIFERRLPPSEPTIYICHSGYSEPGMAPKGSSNLFILTNAPSVSPNWDWSREKEAYGEKLIERLACLEVSGLEHSDVLRYYTPQQLAHDTYAYKGAIYGISSNSMKQTFFRPSNRSRDVDGLWYVGGTTHPGGGTPMVTLSGRLVGEYIASQI